MAEAVIENGFAKLATGEYLAGIGQPVACRGAFSVKSLKGFIVPDRAAVRQVAVAGTSGTGKTGGTDEPAAAYFADGERPFLTRLDAMPDEALSLVSAKLLVAPFASRVGANSLKLVPMSFNRATPVTEFKGGEAGSWVIAATRSRVTRAVLEEGETLTVRPEALVAWTGSRPSGFCPRLSVLDIILPRGPKNLAYTFHGPAIVWFEGSVLPKTKFRQNRI